MDDQEKTQFFHHEKIEKEKEIIVPQSMYSNESWYNVISIDAKYTSNGCLSIDKSHSLTEKQHASDARFKKLKMKIRNLDHFVKEGNPPPPQNLIERINLQVPTLDISLKINYKKY